MLEIEEKMIELLKSGVTFSKLKTRTGLCSSELVKKMNTLKNRGYIINKQFNEQCVKFIIGDKIGDILQDNIKIKFDNKFNFMVLSDTHLGDLVEGNSLKESKDFRIKRFTVNDQVDYLTRMYPKHDSINTMYILGNHDNRWLDLDIDISKIIDKRRYDMHFLGYKNSKIIIGNKKILLHHPFTIDRNFKYDNEVEELYPNCHFDLILRGHTHHNGIYMSDTNGIVVNVPACYDSPNRQYVGAYVITLKNDQVELEQLIVDDKVENFSHIKFQLNDGNNYSNEQNVKKKKR